MSIKDAFEACLIELNKVQAPSLLLKDFIYMFNKSILQYINRKYNLFEVNLLATDDLRVLTNSVKIDKNSGLSKHSSDEVFEDSYDCELPNDYVHILNVICEFQDNSPLGRCKNKCRMIRTGANKLDTNQWSSVITNYYMRPSVKQPYYYIININNLDPNDPEHPDADMDPNQRVRNKLDKTRYGNPTLPIMLIKYGNDANRYELKAVYVDYLRAPRYINLDQDDLDKIGDNTLILEFPDYVIYEIINEIVRLVMENAQNPRIQTLPAFTTTIPTIGNSTK